VLFNGAGMSLQGWQPLYPEIEKLGRVFGWNRFGMQGSDAPRERQTGARVLGSLRELLGYVAIAPPYVLVAHSLGGLFANLYARLYPEEVAGVLVGMAFGVPLAAGVVVAATDAVAAGVIVAAVVAAGVALALVEADVLVVVLGAVVVVVPVVVVPVVVDALTPKVAGTLTP
jgi:pimeloyl-ACP methyl ester carboxylesterase